MWMQRPIIGVLAAASLSACAGTNTYTPVAFPELPAGDVFAVAVRDICFGFLDRGLSHAALAEEALFTASVGISERLRQRADEVIYTAAFASAPVLVSVMENGSRCSVTAVRGDYEELKALSEEEIAAFSDKYGKRAPEHISFVESDPEQDYILKFTLLSGDALDSEDK